MSPTQEEDSQPKPPRKKKRWGWGRRFGFTIALVAVILGAVGGIEYARLDPNAHFSKPPLVAQPSPGTSTGAPITLHAGEFNLLLLGVDSRTPNAPARSDSILLIHINFNKQEYNILSLARDTRVAIPPYGMTKLTHANYLGDLHGGTPLGGIKLATQTVSDFTGLPINYYAETSHFGLQALVDSIGGVTVQVPFKVPIVNAWFPDLNGTTIPAGNDHLTGEMASELVHQRELLPQGDFSRQQLQEDLLLAIARKLRSPQNWAMIPGFLQNLPKFLTATNMSTEDMLSMGLSLHSFKKSDVHYYQVPGYSGQYMDPVVGAVLDYWVPDMTQLQAIIKAHFAD